jgi:deoxyadenosine/deoxycytidine kinase
MIKIAVTGVQGSGKTTLVKALGAMCWERDSTVKLVDEVARDSPLPINEDATVLSQNYLFAEQLSRETVAECGDFDIVICDRSIIDSMVYYAYMLREHPEYNHAYFYPLLDVAQAHMATYDIVARLPLNIDRIISANDVVRSDSLEFAATIDRMFDWYVGDYVNTPATDVKGLMRGITAIMDRRKQR